MDLAQKAYLMIILRFIKYMLKVLCEFSSEGMRTS
jgi:hypothetical protein